MIRFLLAVLLLIPSFSFAATPKLTFDDAVGVWFRANVVVSEGPDGPVFHDGCSLNLTGLPPAYHKLAKELQGISGFIMAELANEMYWSGDGESFRILVGLKEDWSPATIELIRAAVKRSGFAPGAGFPANTLDLLSFGTQAFCDEGRCDCVPCPSTIKCSCMTPDRGNDGIVTGCSGPRTTCSTSEPIRGGGRFQLEGAWF